MDSPYQRLVVGQPMTYSMSSGVRKAGYSRVLKGGEPDIEGAAKIVLGDWVRGHVPYFVNVHRVSNRILVRSWRRIRLLRKMCGH